MDRRDRRVRGQALVEFTLILPVAILLVFGTMTVWSSGHRLGVYAGAANALGEWIARTGRYDARMRAAIEAQIDGALLVDRAGTYLHVAVVPPGGGITRIGSAPPATAATPPVAPASTGWAGALTAIEDGSLVTVEIWGYDEWWFGIAGVPRYRVVVGRSVWEARPVG